MAFKDASAHCLSLFVSVFPLHYSQHKHGAYYNREILYAYLLSK